MDLDPEGLRDLLEGGRAEVLDVRTPEEFALLGHIPGARLIPVQELADRLAEVPVTRPDQFLVAVCEHGIRSRWACDLLGSHHPGRIGNLVGGMSAWPYEREKGMPAGENGHDASLPSDWLLSALPHLPRGTVLDVACGRGCNALSLARLGWRVVALDRDEDALLVLESRAASYGIAVTTLSMDLEACERLPAGPFDVVVVFNYLHRPLFPALRQAVRPGGAIVYETFTMDQARLGRPTNPDFLLRPGELVAQFDGWSVLDSREGIFSGRAIASLAARKPLTRASGPAGASGFPDGGTA